MVGRLGYGELNIKTANGELSYYIDGGFVQVKGSVVTLLTNRSVPASEIDVQQAEQLLEDSSKQVATTDVEFANRERDQQRARRMLSMAGK